jgi:hypothetical protein
MVATQAYKLMPETQAEPIAIAIVEIKFIAV